MKNVLKHSICYLIGPIDNAKDQGKEWRKDVKENLKDLGIIFLDPTNKLQGLAKEVDNEQNKIKTYKKYKKWNILSKMMKKVVRGDLRSIDYADFVIMYVNTDIHMCGSYHEMTVAINQKKPVLLVIKGGKKMASSWLFGVCDHKYMYDNFDELFLYLKKINNGKEKLNDRWVLIRKQIQEKTEDLKSGRF
jgi:nucleoside 2-deoxyribosyltransferase